MKMNKYWLILLFTFLFSFGHAQPKDSIHFPLKKKLLLTAVSYTGSMIALNELWYKGYERTPFHLFNDNAEWKQMDKFGHSFTSYHLTQTGYDWFVQAGYTKKKSLILGSVFSFSLMAPIEWLDGYSAAYGASIGDLGANLSGSLLFILNESVSKPGLFNFKYSFLPSNYAQYRPNALGRNFYEQWLKDYNGQSYWVSIDLHQLSSNIPEWLNLAIGYGADEMVYARDRSNVTNGFYAFRQFYIALDPDISSIHSNKKWVNYLISFVNTLHIPAPAIEFNKNSTQFWLFK